MKCSGLRRESYANSIHKTKNKSPKRRLFFGAGKGNHLTLRVCVVIVTILVRYTSKIYCLSNHSVADATLSGSLPRVIQGKK